ncbi:MAG: hypothetical protein HYW65_03845 [Candidatus Liptonbacteria bacterium]|nr:hypothetical protein [Candidatus Liptonbacteria bacterium]
MNKQCQNCKVGFEIATDDLNFYSKISVPPPTFCWRCRMQRRDNWRNERSLYKRKCDAPGHSENVISVFSPDAPCIVYDQKYWWSDEWNSLAYGVPYDFSTPFFEQFKALLGKVPLPAVSSVNSVNSDYTNAAAENKNTYLSFAAGFNENVAYSNKIGYGKDSLDCYMATKLELCYENVNCHESYRLLWGVNSKNCRDSYFLYNCKNCSNCFGCANLISKSYHIWNQPYSKEEYTKQLASFDFVTREGIEAFKEKFQKEIVANAVHKYANILNSPHCTGDNINNSKNVHTSFDVLTGSEDSKFLQHCYEEKNGYDCMGAWKYELSYESVDVNIGSNNVATVITYNANANRYTLNCHGCNNIFGCIGLRNKEYCILNRQYSKEEYEKLVPQIVKQMNEMPYTSNTRQGTPKSFATGQASDKGIEYKYGEFFPPELSPWAYNETIAQEYFPLTEEEAKLKGFRWRKSEERHYNATLSGDTIPNQIKDAPDSIVNEVIECTHKGTCNEQCTTAFKIIEQELQLYRKLNLPLPNLCPNCRHYARLAQRNPLQLWKRKCMCAGKNSRSSNIEPRTVYANTAAHFHGTGECPNEFETSYAPERPEIIYCENCYQQEVV